METKKWFKSKTIWGGVATAVIGLYSVAQTVAPSFGANLPPMPDFVRTMLEAVLGSSVVYWRFNVEKKLN